MYRYIDYDEFDIKHPKCFLITIAICTIAEISLLIYYL